ncbi:DUF481 domain-containing protein [bacterium]|jgi:hypothetical protein|nr:DUF481 domain-containing protein [bacterium]
MRFILLSVICVGFVLCGTTSLTAQVNIEAYQYGDAKEMGLKNTVSLRGQLTGGNTDLESGTLSWRTDYHTDTDRAFLLFDYDFGKRDGVQYKDDSFVHFRWMHNIRDMIEIEFFVQNEVNPFISLVNRRVYGAGYRFSLWTIGAQRLVFGTGVMHEEELTNKVSSITQRFLRSTNYLSYFWELSSTVSWSGTGYYQFALSDLLNYRVLLDTELAVKLTDNLSLLLNGNYRFASKPVANIEPTDYSVSNGLRWTF